MIPISAGSVATFKVTTADNTDAGSDPQVAFIYIMPNGDEFLINDQNAFNAMSQGQSLAFNFVYHNSDGSLLSNQATETVTITGVNDAPTAVNDSFSTNEDTASTAANPFLLGNKITGGTDFDPEHDALTIHDVSLAATPITLTGSGGLALGDVAITSLLSNNSHYVAGSVATFQVTTADNTDAGNDPQIAYIYIMPNGNEYLINDQNAFNAMSQGQSLAFNFVYHNSDGSLLSNQATETVTITGVNDAPTAVDDSFSTTRIQLQRPLTHSSLATRSPVLEPTSIQNMMPSPYTMYPWLLHPLP